MSARHAMQKRRRSNEGNHEVRSGGGMVQKKQGQAAEEHGVKGMKWGEAQQQNNRRVGKWIRKANWHLLWAEIMILRILRVFGLISILAISSLGQERKGEWSMWLPAENAVYTYPGTNTEGGRTDISFRWRLCTPCTGKDCTIDLQLRNNQNRRQSINYTADVETEDGRITAANKEHRNIDPHEVQDVPVSAQGTRIDKVWIEFVGKP